MLRKVSISLTAALATQVDAIRLGTEPVTEPVQSEEQLA